jgi:predicted flap endonuclease-1-like 5' DNA nuclease
MLLGAFLLGIWLGWMLWNKYKQEADKLRLDVQSLTATVNTLSTETGTLKSRLAASEANNLSLQAQVSKLGEDNRIFREQLSETSEDLAETEERNRQLETELGLSFTPPASTPETVPLEIDLTPEEIPVDPTPDVPQVVLEIIDTPDEKPAEIVVEIAAPPAAEEPEQPATEIVIDTPAPVEIVVPAAAIVHEKEDLTVVEGIGPKIQELLYQYGILSYRQLAETEVTRLKEILAAAGPQLAMHDPGTWSAQANLAANDKWEDLKAYQGFLKGGKSPVNPQG